MLKFIRGLISDGAAPGPATDRQALPEEIRVAGIAPFRIVGHMSLHNGLPMVDWPSVQSWIDDVVPEKDRAQAWSDCERAWLLHLRHALGPGYHLQENEGAAVLSSLEPHIAKATLEYMRLTLRRIVAVLQEIAQVHEWGKDLLIVFDDEESYYRYVSFYYPDSGEFAFSGGMHIGWGCSHFVTVKRDLPAIEPVIAHEMTHACVSHLPLPAWVNEGIAVNTERRLANTGYARLGAPWETHAKHQQFWNPEVIQEFWSGKSFLRPDEGNSLSYDLARLLIEQFSMDWEPFKAFVLAVDRADGGQAAARKHLGRKLGETVTALLEQPASAGWEPEPSLWPDEPEKGGFQSMQGAWR